MIPPCVKWCAARPSSIGSIEASPTAPAMVVRGQCVAKIEMDSSYTKLRCHYHLTDGVLHSGNDTLIRHTRLRNSLVCFSELLWQFWLLTIVHRCTICPANIFVESVTQPRASTFPTAAKVSFVDVTLHDFARSNRSQNCRA